MKGSNGSFNLSEGRKLFGCQWRGLTKYRTGPQRTERTTMDRHNGLLTRTLKKLTLELRYTRLRHVPGSQAQARPYLNLIVISGGQLQFCGLLWYFTGQRRSQII